MVQLNLKAEMAFEKSAVACCGNGNEDILLEKTQTTDEAATASIFRANSGLPYVEITNIFSHNLLTNIPSNHRFKIYKIKLYHAHFTPQVDCTIFSLFFLRLSKPKFMASKIVEINFTDIT